MIKKKVKQVTYFRLSDFISVILDLKKNYIFENIFHRCVDTVKSLIAMRYWEQMQKKSVYMIKRWVTEPDPEMRAH